jgi:hypothetical protein
VTKTDAYCPQLVTSGLSNAFDDTIDSTIALIVQSLSWEFVCLAGGEDLCTSAWVLLSDRVLCRLRVALSPLIELPYMTLLW